MARSFNCHIPAAAAQILRRSARQEQALILTEQYTLSMAPQSLKTISGLAHLSIWEPIEKKGALHIPTRG